MKTTPKTLIVCFRTVLGHLPKRLNVRQVTSPVSSRKDVFCGGVEQKCSHQPGFKTVHLTIKTTCKTCMQPVNRRIANPNDSTVPSQTSSSREIQENLDRSICHKQFAIKQYRNRCFRRQPLRVCRNDDKTIRSGSR